MPANSSTSSNIASHRNGDYLPIRFRGSLISSTVVLDPPIDGLIRSLGKITVEYLTLPAMPQAGWPFDSHDEIPTHNPGSKKHMAKPLWPIHERVFRGTL